MAKRRSSTTKNKRKKALKRARKLKDRTRRGSSGARSPVENPQTMSSGRPPMLADNPHRPDWANVASYSPFAAETAAHVGSLMDGVALHPNQVAKLREFIGWSGSDWTISRARSTPTDELVTRLEGLGVEVTPSSFAALASEHWSAWGLAKTWDVPEASEQFLGLCACELWRRWCPEPPSLEMIDDLFQLGYADWQRGDAQSGSLHLLEAWDQLCVRLPDTIQSLDDATAAGFLQHLGNCLQDTMEFVNNTAIEHAELAKRGVAWCQKLRARFPAEHRLLSQQEADFLLMLEREKEAEALLSELLANDPDDPMPYAMLADHLGWGRRGKPARDLPRAVALLEEALSRPVRDAQSWDLISRLEGLRASLSDTAAME